MGFSVSVRNAMLDWWFSNLSSGYTTPSKLYLAFIKTDGTEVTGGNYSRCETNVSDWDAAVDGVVVNNTKFTFATPTGTWGSIQYVKIYDQDTGGTELGVSELASIREVTSVSPAPEIPVGTGRFLIT
jgi:hypothetical protein